MSGNGAMIGREVTRAGRRLILRDLQKARAVCIEAVAGAIVLRIVVLLIVAAAAPPIAATQ